jgi:hypothetical protein
VEKASRGETGWNEARRWFWAPKISAGEKNKTM